MTNSCANTMFARCVNEAETNLHFGKLLVGFLQLFTNFF